MGVLTINENGEQRAFRVSEGTLSVGSGEAVDLRLNVAEVAAHHANLECLNESLLIEPLPGVTPPSINGVPLKKKTRLGPGQEFRIGKARISWTRDEAKLQPIGTAAAQSSAAPAKQPATTSKSAGRKGKSHSSSSAASRSAPSRRRAAGRSNNSLPSGVIVGIILLVVGLGAFFFTRQIEKGNSVANAANAQFHLRKAEEMMDALNTDVAKDHLDKLDEASLSAEERVRFNAVEKRLNTEFAKIEAEKEEAAGLKWFVPNLEEYEKYYLAGTPEMARVRLFLERCDEFRKRWPNHPKLSWVERQERRFKGLSELDAPMGFEDVIWRARLYTDTRPRDYRKALALLEDYRDKTETAEQRIALSRLVDELIESRKEYHADQLQFARGEYKKGNISRAIEWLVQSIIGLGDTDMENEAAEILTKFSGVKSVLLGYREFRPDDYAFLMENPIMADFMSDAD